MPSIYINESDASGQDQLFISNIYSGKILGEIMRLQDKIVNITQNGTQEVTYDSNYTGLNKVTINTNVPNPSTGTINITTNGTYDVTEKASAVVNVPSAPTLAKTVTFKTPNGTDPETYTDYQISSVKNGVNLSAPVSPEQQGAEFRCWKKGENVLTFPISYSNITDGDEYVAELTPHIYLVRNSTDIATYNFLCDYSVRGSYENCILYAGWALMESGYARVIFSTNTINRNKIILDCDITSFQSGTDIILFSVSYSDETTAQHTEHITQPFSGELELTIDPTKNVTSVTIGALTAVGGGRTTVTIRNLYFY